MTRTLALVLALNLLVPFGLAQADLAAVTDDATMARLRVAHVVYGGPNVDVLLNGVVAMNPGQPQANIHCCQVSGYLYLEPGSYSLAVVPTGEAIEAAILGPLELRLEAGRRYTVAMMGQREDASLTPLVIDETAAVREVRTDPNQTINIFVNNLAGTETLSVTFDGHGPRDAPYGGFAVAALPFGPERYIEVTANGGRDIVEAEQWDAESDTEIPGIDFMHLRFGRFPGTWGVDHGDTEGIGVSTLNALTFLQGFSGLGAQEEGRELSFDTFLEAVERAGLAEMLMTGGPFLLYVPTDEAFANMPADRLEQLMADPEALARWLRYHIVPGYHPPGSLSGEVYGTVDRKLSTLTGATLRPFVFGDTLYINGIPQGSLQRYQVANGSFVRPVTTVLEPLVE